MGRKRKTDQTYLQLKDMKVETNPPKIGEIRTGFQRGLRGTYFKYIWAACERCGKPRWVVYRPTMKQPQARFCRKCTNIERGLQCEAHPCWRGGRKKGGGGYVYVKLATDDFFYPMTAAHGYVREHRLVMAKHLGRCLWDWEVVHHKNHIRDDNRIENLEIAMDMPHKQQTILETKIRDLEKRVMMLEVDNTLLRTQLAFWTHTTN